MRGEAGRGESVAGKRERESRGMREDRLQRKKETKSRNKR